MAKKSSHETLKGTVLSFNISPKGMIEGVLVKNTDSQTVQVNFYPEFGAYIGDKLKVGEKVNLQVEREDQGKGSAHTVYCLLRFKSATGKDISFEEGLEEVSSKGTIKQLNYALHGEPNGVILDNGDFLHMKPKGFKEADLEIGQKVTARGELKLSFLEENRVIEVYELNGIKLKDGRKEKSKHKKAA